MLIREMDVTRSYLELDATSIHDYLIRIVGYSGGSACRRIDAARLSKDVPELTGKLQVGAITLNQVTLVKKSIRVALKNRRIAAEDTRDLFARLEGKSDYESQKTVSEFFDIPIVRVTREIVQSDESVRLEVTLSKELYAKLKRAQELLSHSVPSREFIEFLEYVTSKIIDQKTRMRGVKADQAKVAKTLSTAIQDATATVAVKPAAAPNANLINVQLSLPRPTAPVAAKDRREVLSETGGCKQRLTDGSFCGSHWQLQVDHIQPVWAGGNNDRANLQPLCAKHNRWRYRRQTGTKTLPENALRG